MTITEFLLARIAEDEAEATERGAEPWYDGGWPKEHVARLLKEYATKRAIIKQAEAASEDRESVIQEFCAGMDETRKALATDPGKLILESLAAVYSDHPDYQQEWAV